MAENIRSFIAIVLNEEAILALRDVQSALRKKPSGQVGRWARPEDTHLTLKFLGDVPATQIPQIVEAMKQACDQHGPFDISLTGLGCFPNMRRPRVVWVGVGGDVAALRRLQQDVEEAMNGLGYPPEERGFSPHLTLARVARNAKPGDVEALGQEVQRITLGEIAHVHVERVHLMRSDLRPSGAVYTELAAAALLARDASLCSA